MTPTAIITVSAAVLTCTQFAKWSGVPDRAGPLAVLLLSALGVGLWVFSSGPFLRTNLFDYFAAWLAVSTSASGVYGFSRASGEALTKLTAPPSGGGAETTVKSHE